MAPAAGAGWEDRLEGREGRPDDRQEDWREDQRENQREDWQEDRGEDWWEDRQDLEEGHQEKELWQKR